MNPILLQATYSSSSSQIAMPVAWMSVLLVPVIMLFVGTILGSMALRDIRLANGKLGGAGLATFAAGLLPSLSIIAACSAGLVLFMESISPPERRRYVAFLILGLAMGGWLSFLMLRGMHRQAVGWTPPATTAPGLAAPQRSALATTSLILTILGGALFLLILVVPRGVHIRTGGFHSEDLRIVSGPNQPLFLLHLACLIAGLICGVLARREKSARVCAWTCGCLFAVALLFSA